MRKYQLNFEVKFFEEKVTSYTVTNACAVSASEAERIARIQITKLFPDKGVEYIKLLTIQDLGKSG